MVRRIGAATLVRVRANQGTFIGHVAAVGDSGLEKLVPDPNKAWSGPVDLLAWDDIRTIEVRRRSPMRTAAVGGAVGLVAGLVGAKVDFEANGGNDLAMGVLYSLAGLVVGMPIGFGVGLAMPIWEPLYRAP